MAKTSINIQPCKVAQSERHNNRRWELTEDQKMRSKVREELSPSNERAIYDNRPLSQILEDIKKTYKASKGKKMHAKATPLREGVVVIKEDTTLEDLKRFTDEVQRRWGPRCVQAYIHKDEGHWEDKEWKPNYHAHLVFDWTDKNGMTYKLDKLAMQQMQTLLAESLEMERGENSEREHLNATQYANQQELKKTKELKEEKETVGKEVAEARKTHKELTESNEVLESTNITLENKKREKQALLSELESEAVKVEETLSTRLKEKEQAERELSEIKSAGEIRREEASKALDGAFGAVTGYLQGVGKKAEKARQTLKEHAERIPEIEEGKRIIERSKELTGENKPQMDDIIARHTKETFWGNKKTDYKAALADYQEVKETENYALKSRLKVKEEEVKISGSNWKHQVNLLNGKIERLEKELQNEKKNRNYIEERVATELGEKFMQLWNDCKDYFRQYIDKLALTISLWLGQKLFVKSEQSDRLNETYTANREEARLRINGLLIPDWETRKEDIEREEAQKREEEELSQRPRSRGFHL